MAHGIGILLIIIVVLEALYSGTFGTLVWMSLSGYGTYVAMQVMGEQRLAHTVIVKLEALKVKADWLNQALAKLGEGKGKLCAHCANGVDLLCEFHTLTPPRSAIKARITYFEGLLIGRHETDQNYARIVDQLRWLNAVDADYDRTCDRCTYAREFIYEFGANVVSRPELVASIHRCEQDLIAMKPFADNQRVTLNLRARLMGVGAFLCPLILLVPVGWFMYRLVTYPPIAHRIVRIKQRVLGSWLYIRWRRMCRKANSQFLLDAHDNTVQIITETMAPGGNPIV